MEEMTENISHFKGTNKLNNLLIIIIYNFINIKLNKTKLK